jgi:hypothetical protein
MVEISSLSHALGTRRFEESYGAMLEALGAAALLDALLAALETNEPLGEPDANGRAVFEDIESCLVRLAHLEADRFLDRIAPRPSLLASFPVVSALTRLEGPRAEGLLESLVGSRSGSIRWLALSALVERSSTLVGPLLGPSLRDRDGLVVFAAVCGLRRLGASEHLAALEAIAANSRSAPGTREAALDAIEAIHVREARPLPDGRRPRLLAIEVPKEAVVNVIVGSSFDAGFVLARVGEVAIQAPCAAVVAGLDTARDASGRAVGMTVVLRVTER